MYKESALSVGLEKLLLKKTLIVNLFNHSYLERSIFWKDQNINVIFCASFTCILEY